jgi:hypothetical protein
MEMPTVSEAALGVASIQEPKPWEIKLSMSPQERALRSVFDPIRSTPDFKGIRPTPDLVRHLVVKYTEELGAGQKIDEDLMGLISDFLKPE